MRNDFGSRPYSSRFPYKKGKSVSKKKKKQGYKDREDESLGMRTGKNPLRNNLWKIVEMSLMENGAKENLVKLISRFYGCSKIWYYKSS